MLRFPQPPGGFLSASPSPTFDGHSDTVSESSDNATLLSLSREDLSAIGAGSIREDVRVSRKKLENLILNEREENPERNYIDTIMDATNTFIQWPSRMKIGAKTKKDLFVRIYGHTEEEVTEAKTRILSGLGPQRDLRVTLKMEISYTDHSHLIGCRGATIRQVMEDTGCHIHFPDSNRMSKDQKSNQVTIAGGSVEAVEQARCRVRELSPLILQFCLPLNHQTSYELHMNADHHHVFMDNVQSTYNVQITVHPPNKLQKTTVSVKGCEIDATSIKEAVKEIYNYFSPSPQGGLSVESIMEISAIQHGFVRSLSDSNVHSVMMNTGAKVIFPDLTDNNIQQIKRSRVYIHGEMNSVYHARQQLIGCLPLRMIFDVNDDFQLDWDFVRAIGAELNVNVKMINRNRSLGGAGSLPPPVPGRSRTVQLVAAERNTANLYEARRRILGGTEVPVNANIPSNYCLRPVFPPGAFFSTLLNGTPPAPPPPPGLSNVMGMNQLLAPPSPNPSLISPVLSPSFWPPTPFNTPFLSPQMMMGMGGYQRFQLTPDHMNSQQPQFQKTKSIPMQSLLSTQQQNQKTQVKESPKEIFPSTSTDIGSLAEVEQQRRAPGFERSNPDFEEVTAVERKLQAMKAMYDQRISGLRVRVPNSEWAGCGFSKTTSSLLSNIQPFDTTEPEMNNNVVKVVAERPPPLVHSQSSLLDTANLGLNNMEAPDLTVLFLDNGLEKYVDTFRSNEVDLEYFKSMEEEDLRNLGVTSYPARKKMLLLIKVLNAA